MYKRLLVPLDGSDSSQRGLAEAIALARALGATLRLLHVVTDPPSLVEWTATASLGTLRREWRHDVHGALCRYGAELLTAAEKAAAAEGVVAETALREAGGAPVADLIVDEAAAAEADAIVMGTHGRRGLRRLVLGSDASLVVATSALPVLLVPRARAGAT